MSTHVRSSISLLDIHKRNMGPHGIGNYRSLKCQNMHALILSGLRSTFKHSRRHMSLPRW